MDSRDLEHRFSFHPANDEITRGKHETVRSECKYLALTLNQILPEGREKAVVMTKLEEVMFWANAAIAREKRDEV